MNDKMDEGDIIKILKFPLIKQDNAKTVIDKFVEKWPEFVVNALWDFAKWKLKRIPQNHDEATYCGKFTKQDGQISFQNETAEDIYSKFQAFYLWPGIYTYWNWKLVKFTEIDFQDGDLEPGKVFFEDGVLKIWAKKWVIIVKKLKPEWKKELTANEFVNGYRDFIWSKLD